MKVEIEANQKEIQLKKEKESIVKVEKKEEIGSFKLLKEMQDRISIKDFRNKINNLNKIIKKQQKAISEQENIIKNL